MTTLTIAALTEEQAYNFLVNNSEQILGNHLYSVHDLLSVNVLRNVINELRDKQLDFYGWINENWRELEDFYGCRKTLKNNYWGYSLTYRAIVYALSVHTETAFYQPLQEISLVDDNVTEKLNTVRRDIADRISALEQEIEELREKKIRIDNAYQVLNEVLG